MCEAYFVVNIRGEEMIIVFLFSCIIRDTVNLMADNTPLKNVFLYCFLLDFQIKDSLIFILFSHFGNFSRRGFRRRRSFEK